MTGAIEPLARAGYAARGAVYLIVGFFALLAALGRSETKGTEDSLRVLLAQPFGRILVWIMILGLFAYALWRLIQGMKDVDGHGSGFKGLAIRAGLLGSGITNALLALFALGLVSSWGSGGGGDPSRQWLNAAFEAGLAQVLVWLVALILAVVALAHFWRSWKASFEKYFRCPERIMRWLRPLGRLGLAARGLVFLTLAYLVLRGGLAYSKEQQPGLNDALQALQQGPYGWLVLLAVALGLIAFAGYSVAEARYRHIEVS